MRKHVVEKFGKRGGGDATVFVSGAVVHEQRVANDHITAREHDVRDHADTFAFGFWLEDWHGCACDNLQRIVEVEHHRSNPVHHVVVDSMIQSEPALLRLDGWCGSANLPAFPVERGFRPPTFFAPTPPGL